MTGYYTQGETLVVAPWDEPLVHIMNQLLHAWVLVGLPNMLINKGSVCARHNL